MSQVDKEHLIKGELIERLKPYYAPDHSSPFEKFLNGIKGIFRGNHHDHHIDVLKYQHQPLSQYSENEVLNRTVFALKKIKEFNHHFFTEREVEILNPQPMGLISTLLHFGSAALDGGIAAIMYRNKHFSTKSLSLFGGLLAAEYVIIKVPNIINEYYQGFYRRNLAAEYLNVYGPQFFHEIIDPRYDLEEIRNFHNKLHHNESAAAHTH